MTKMKLFLAAVGILGTGFAVDRYAQLQHLYFIEGWLDTPLHFLCGIGAGFLTLWLVSIIGLLPVDGQARAPWDESFGRRAPWWRTFVVVLAGVAVIGIVWELYEVFMFSLTDKPLSDGYIFDTLKDIVNDFLGGSLAWAAFYRVQWKIWQVEAGLMRHESHSMAAPGQEPAPIFFLK